jgi:predicted small metal-binding protein
MTLEFRCADVGLACGDRVTAESEDELVGRIAAHARDEHGVELNQTLVDYARSQVRSS